MKKFWIAALMCLSVSVAHADFSNGYRLGNLNKYSITGTFNKSGEGELNMGRDGAPLFKTDKKGNRSYTNPWRFSSSDINKFSNNFMGQFAGEYVVVQYRQDFGPSGFTQETAYNIVDIKKIDAANKPVACVDASASGNQSDGFSVGRIVKASTKGTFSKSFEIMVQQGNSGNTYRDMSILSQKMYECAIANLKSAKQVKVYYRKAWMRLDFGTQDTNFSIWKIEPVGDI
jgi:hypothetical protein